MNQMTADTCNVRAPRVQNYINIEKGCRVFRDKKLLKKFVEALPDDVEILGLQFNLSGYPDFIKVGTANMGHDGANFSVRVEQPEPVLKLVPGPSKY